MITLDDLKNKYLGKPVDPNNNGDIQCVDLVEAYNAEVIGAPKLGGNAKDLVKNTQPSYYEYVKNTLMYIPPTGAIVIWNERVGGGYGHTGIVLTAGLMTFTSLEQNWLLHKYVEIVNHGYTNVAGFLVPRNSVTTLKYNQLVDELQTLARKYNKV